MVERRDLVGEHVVAELRRLPHLQAEHGQSDLDRYRHSTRQPQQLPGGHALGRKHEQAYVASSIFSNSSSSGSPARLHRFSYSSATDSYSLDVGFPVQIGNFKTEALTIAKDSTGQLWSTRKQGSTFVVNASVCNPGCNDAAWGTPFTPNAPRDENLVRQRETSPP